MIDITKKYKYRNGEPARILCVDRPSDNYPIVSMDNIGNTFTHAADGRLDRGAAWNSLDLIEVKEKAQCPHCGQEMEKPSQQKTLEFWVNIHGEDDFTIHTSKKRSDRNKTDATARKHVVIEYEEGEGL